MADKKITILGDIHGKYSRMHEIIREKDRSEYIVALGDVGFDYSTLDNVDPKKFVIVGGNHENYSKIINIPHYLGDYGFTSLNGINLFYYRGAYSIDKQHRTIGIDWWPEEQVSVEQFMKARDLYRSIKPDIMLTHDCPETISPYLLKPGAQIYQNQTGYFLQELFNIHQPKRWFFGHYHKSWQMTINGTDFRCLNELETCSLEI
jgi:hypothetical protein